MRFKNIAVLTSQESWFLPYSRQLVSLCRKKGWSAKLFFKHQEIPAKFEIVFALSYFGIMPKSFLKEHSHTFVVHESNLPEGRGWAPLFWQISRGKNKIPIVLFKAEEKLDSGPVYLKDVLTYRGDELHDEIRKKQAQKTITLCLRFLARYNSLKPMPQEGKATYYRRRTPSDSRLDIEKSIQEQFNLLRIVSNRQFPAFFYYRGHKYVLRISEA